MWYILTPSKQKIRNRSNVIDRIDFPFHFCRPKKIPRLWNTEILAQHIIWCRASWRRLRRRGGRNNNTSRTLSVFRRRTNTSQRDNATGKWSDNSALPRSKLRGENRKNWIYFLNRFWLPLTVNKSCSYHFCYKVSWVRRKGDQLHLLTFGESLYSSDSRFAFKFKSPNDWQLHIQYANERDEGQFECQINTSPTLVFIVYLIVVGKL